MPPQNTSALKYIIPIVILVILLAGVSYFAFTGFKRPQLTPSMGGSLSSTDDSFFSSQTATVQGKITRVNGQTITVENTRKEARDLKLSPNFSSFDLENPGATPSANINEIKTDKNAVITLTLTTEGYAVTNISYQPYFAPFQTPNVPDTQTTTTSTSPIDPSQTFTPPPLPSLPSIPQNPTTGKAGSEKP